MGDGDGEAVGGVVGSGDLTQVQQRPDQLLHLALLRPPVGGNGLLDLERALTTQAVRTVPGLGKKTAERLVLELRGKNLAAFDPGINGGNVGGPYVEAREALTALGYSLEEAESALKEVPPQDSVQRYVKEALRRMGGTRR